MQIELSITTLNWLDRASLCVFLIIAFALSGCKGYPNSPEGVVRNVYNAIWERNQDKYIDCLAPESRISPVFFFPGSRETVSDFMNAISLSSKCLRGLRNGAH